VTPSAMSSRSIGGSSSAMAAASRSNRRGRCGAKRQGLLHDLGVEVTRFDTAFERGLYPSLGLTHGVFFDRDSFGRDALVAGDVMISRASDMPHPALEGFIAAIPISEAGRAQLLSLYDRTRDPLAGRSVDQKLKILKTTSYRDYLVKYCGCGEDAANCFQGRPLGFFGLGCD